MLRNLLLPLLLIISAPSPAHALLDGDGDGTPNRVDALPCDGTAVGLAYAPGEGERGLILFEDMWPAAGDLDFNDLVLTYHYEARLDAAGALATLRVTYDVLAIGGILDNGLGLRLPIPRSAVARVTRTIDGASVELTPSDDEQLTVAVAPSLRGALELPAGIINALPSVPRVGAESIELEIELATPHALSMGEAPFDVFIFRSDRPAHEIHLPGYGGTAAMDEALFGTADDRSTPTRHFVDQQGLPFALVIPSSATYPREGVALSSLYPDVVTFAQSGGAAGADFYTRPLSAHAYVDSAGQGRLSLPALSPSSIDRSCVPPPCVTSSAQLSCGVGACSRSVPECVDEEANACAPGAPASETCNGIDDDCNGLVDDTECGVPTGGVGGRLATGERQTCAISSGSPPRVVCWGYGLTGSVNAAGLVLSPRVVLGTDNAIWVAIEEEHGCAVRANGTVVCWGRQSTGQLGNGVSSSALENTVRVPGISTAVAVTVGIAHSCALLADGQVRCWGSNSFGQVGTGATTPTTILSPATVVGLQDVTEIRAGSQHTCALRSNGEVWCWGNGYRGGLGDGVLGSHSVPTPTRVLGLSGVVRLGISPTSSGSSCALLRDGTVRCWGHNLNGRLGDDSLDDAATPRVVTGVSAAVDIDISYSGACATRSDGRIVCWGSNADGALGIGTTTDVGFNKGYVNDITTAVGVRTGDRYGCALLSNDRVRCWGRGNSGQLGDGNSAAPRTSPTAEIALDDARGPEGRLAASIQQTCAISSGPTPVVRCWGDASGGVMPGTSVTGVRDPRVISGTDNAVWVAVSEEHACAVRANGTVLCWGSQALGRIGNGSTAGSLVNVTQVPGISTAVAVTVGASHTCALLADGQVRCWGSSQYGKIGHGSTGGASTAVTQPTAVVGLSNVTEVRAGSEHTCALLATGEVWCWGRNQVGQLGDGTPPGSSSAHSNVPVRVLGASNVTRLGVGFQSSCALLQDGTARCWGLNSGGQLGNGTSGTGTNQASPSVVTDLSDLTGLHIGGGGGCAVRADETVSCWGHGSLRGDGTGTNGLLTKSVVSTITNAVEVVVGGSTSSGTGYACALLHDERVRCWGRNLNGQLGDGTLTNRLTPSTLIAPTP